MSKSKMLLVRSLLVTLTELEEKEQKINRLARKAADLDKDIEIKLSCTDLTAEKESETKVQFDSDGSLAAGTSYMYNPLAHMTNLFGIGKTNSEFTDTFEEKLDPRVFLELLGVILGGVLKEKAECVAEITSLGVDLSQLINS